MPKHSQQVQNEALKVAKSIQKPKQTKEQTKLIAQGIEKGIAEYKKQQSKKSRERDKAKKLILKEKARQDQQSHGDSKVLSPKKNMKPLPWILLALSWLGFIFYINALA